MLQEVVESSSVENSLIRSYKRSFNGFAANLTANERQKLARMKEVVSIFPSATLKLHTTKSWDFMGFNGTISRENTAESDVIIGVMDTGIWPESESFNDKGFGPAPKKWKGACEGGENFTCNNKVVGARHYALSAPGSGSARDENGHGSHTASTAAGNIVKNVSFYGLAEGTARGGVPSARIAVYKVCEPDGGCDTTNILAAFDDAIADGVDIITISLGSDGATDFDTDVIAIGSFHAMKKGIVTLQSAGNSGCVDGSVSSTAPWILTVGASSTDRKIIDEVILGNGSALIGASINSFTLNGTMLSLVYGKDVSHRSCRVGCLDENLVKGKIVLCGLFEGIAEAYKAGALGAVVLNTQLDDVPFVVPLPASAVTLSDMFMLEDYVNFTKNPTVNILKSRAIRDFNAPVVASFSACGPNQILAEIMKPDVVAPGINILAAFSPIASPSNGPLDRRQVQYNFLSGTSMSCPHAAGVAAYVKSIHPQWSPSAIKSAIMTTAWPMNGKGQRQEFSYGSGHINPIKAADPGLVFDADKEDYIKLLCGAGFDSDALEVITGESITCATGVDKLLPFDFNYPAITFRVSPMVALSFKFHRTVTNVGEAKSVYKAKIITNNNMTVQVQPEVLSFKSLNEKKSFVVSVEAQGIPDSNIVTTSLVWSDATHNVRIPIILLSLRTD
ncbi:hypothetical protein MANES_01G167601v8 [Manihot esculenta]|uniref:Uncharacterized protein n=1 Tax=Manihot esculenta TaxID=3983 RepID=A0A2C9WLJ0_MANES|nr:hypothetical protein MANES_01G167601v8 [Manihot esculenta]